MLFLILRFHFLSLLFYSFNKSIINSSIVAIDQAYAEHENLHSCPFALVISGNDNHSLFSIKNLCGAK